MFIARLLFLIQIALIYLTYLHSSCEPETTKDMTKEQRESIMREFAALAQERLFKFKGNPNPDSQNRKLYVPKEMLQKYIGYREEVRSVVPDDREFLGKINIAELDSSHEDMWSALSNNAIGDIQVEMGPPEDRLDERKFNVDGKASHIAYLTLQGDPEVLSPKIDHLLPPHSRSVKSQKRFVSVHMKFNLSQEVYSGSTAADDLKGAELRLTRENIHNCEFNDCPKKPVPFFSHQNQENTTKLDNRINLIPRYQKVYILQVHGYDQYNEPIVTVSSTRRIDTSQTSPLIFNIKHIVRTWLLDPKTNYGIIVRVTNDDKDYELALKVQEMHGSSRKRETNATDETQAEPFRTIDLLDHVRLRRSSHLGSDSKEVWLENQPALLVYSNLKDPEERTETDEDSDPNRDPEQKYHVKRDDSKPTVSRRATQPGRASSSGGGRTSKGKPRPSVKQSEKCGVRQLNINFDEVGWSSWIIAPHSYYANYCAGDCSWPLTDAQNSTNHAIVQAIYRSVGRLVPKSSCAPVKYGKMAILYQLDGVVQMRQYDDMIVQACGCY